MKASIKGMAITGLVADLAALRREGRASDEALGKHLAPDDFALLDETLDPFGWYPIQTYERLTNALLELSGNPGVPWLRERGAAAARRLLERGLYQQLDALKEGSRWTHANYLSRLRRIVTLSGSMLSFSTWRAEPDPDHERRVRIVITDAADCPEVLRHVLDGFVNACADVAGSSYNWHSERVSPDRIVIQMDSDIGEDG